MKKTPVLAVVTLIASLALLSSGLGASKSSKSAKAGDKRVEQAVAPGDEPKTSNEDVTSPAAGARQMLGTFVGAFGPHRITVCLQNLIGRTVNGYSVVAGNERAFSGSLVDNDRGFELHAREPGDDAGDGVFNFLYRPDTKHLTGSWQPNNKKLASRTFGLERRDFRYDPKAGAYPQSSTKRLKTADVENLAAADLRIMRNEIYARHGYTFRMKDMREHFDQQSWYMPISMNVSTQLTKIEEDNAALIKKYESYGENYYDAFGR